ncbi:hypothetical protein Q8A67_020462 [Cirrhinus molitorella]|uniref:Proline rich 15 like n=1 Tax=Cirrhinus molitorella TaxID=172907 RepID=A0AA88TGZ7_9TELE|nr:hypothetical protein Q8A67_020462 [Cirrhinus molitorella]
MTHCTERRHSVVGRLIKRTGSKKSTYERSERIFSGLLCYLPFAPVMADPAWWKLTFLRKKKSEPKVLYEIPPDFSTNNAKKDLGNDDEDSNLDARLEKIVDKNATKGRHVKVSHSGRFKEKKKIRATLAENPSLFPEPGRTDKSHVEN